MVDILNYRADGTPIRNRLMLAPLPDPATGKLGYFSGVQKVLGEVREVDGPGGQVRLRVADDGNGLPPGTTGPGSASLGGRLVLSLARSLDVQSGLSGTCVTLTAPATAR
jgi:two-component sensor histidine kinase